MSTTDRFFIFFCTSPALKIGCCVPLLGLAWLTGSWFGLLLLLLIPAGESWGAHLVCSVYHPSLMEDLEEQLTASCQSACAIHPGEHHYVFTETAGSLEHRLLNRLPETLVLTVLAPKRDYTVMAKREGLIFPPLQYFPPKFDTSDLGCVEIYYRDIEMVELENGIMRLHTQGGREHEFPAKDGPASEAALYLRQRLRDYKARSGDGFSA